MKMVQYTSITSRTNTNLLVLKQVCFELLSLVEHLREFMKHWN